MMLQKKPTKRRAIPSSFDVIGNKDRAVAIIEVPQPLQKRKKLLADAVMLQHKNVVSVLEKASPRFGTFRTRKLKIIKGSRNTEVVHVESGCRFAVDPRNSYFSQREGTERMRVASLVKEGESVMVFFAGIGPFAIVIAKKARPRAVVGVEINPAAVKCFEKSITLNKLDNVKAVLGDVHEKSRDYHGFDRVIMPLPETSFDFIEDAKRVLRKGGVMHVYFFAREDEVKMKKKFVAEKLPGSSVQGVSRVLPYGPRIWKWRMDVATR
ncbi:MAG: class I SAM-dependent methyltransferase family protein [Candidatus Aenigmarchaeota archaeon]|nr:class I SAM-dependent methyltransferase family protein [Candidatus Aenigmarchaeota archaeon]